MDEKYFPEQIEERWQKFWEESGAFEVERDPSREKRDATNQGCWSDV